MFMNHAKHQKMSLAPTLYTATKRFDSCKLMSELNFLKKYRANIKKKSNVPDLNIEFCKSPT